ncbi:MAG TPA: hypothetical protein VGK74_02510 [Symbiobacteriaceae bacterium]
MADETLEQKADRLYEWIHDYLVCEARKPSHKEMAAGLHFSTETIQKCLNHLEATGRPIHHIRNRARQVWVPVREIKEE